MTSIKLSYHLKFKIFPRTIESELVRYRGSQLSCHKVAPEITIKSGLMTLAISWISLTNYTKDSLGVMGPGL